MPKARKRKVPITTTFVETCRSSKPYSSRNLIRRFHILLKRKAQLEGSPTLVADTSRALGEVEEQIAEIGGLESYQQMSAIGQGNDRGGGSEKVLISWLKDMEVRKKYGSTRLRLLEVGALKHDNYRSCLSWIDATPIDLCSRHPSILQQDFLLLDNDQHHERWNIVSLSLVLNFVPVAKDRGRMFRLAYRILIPGGLLFLTLPLPCVANSRYLDFAHLKGLMETVGFTQLKERWREGRKMAYWLYQKAVTSDPDERFRKKVVLREGDRNNFCILL